VDGLGTIIIYGHGQPLNELIETNERISCFVENA